MKGETDERREMMVGQRDCESDGWRGTNSRRKRRMKDKGRKDQGRKEKGKKGEGEGGRIKVAMRRRSRKIEI